MATMSTKIILDVPYGKIDEAKKLGAQWCLMAPNQDVARRCVANIPGTKFGTVVMTASGGGGDGEASPRCYAASSSSSSSPCSPSLPPRQSSSACAPAPAPAKRHSPLVAARAAPPDARSHTWTSTDDCHCDETNASGFQVLRVHPTQKGTGCMVTVDVEDPVSGGKLCIYVPQAVKDGDRCKFKTKRGMGCCVRENDSGERFRSLTARHTEGKNGQRGFWVFEDAEATAAAAGGADHEPGDSGFDEDYSQLNNDY